MTDQSTIDILREQKATLEADIATLPESDRLAIDKHKDAMLTLIQKGGPAALAALSLVATEVAEASYEMQMQEQLDSE